MRARGNLAGVPVVGQRGARARRLQLSVDVQTDRDASRATVIRGADSDIHIATHRARFDSFVRIAAAARRRLVAADNLAWPFPLSLPA